MTFYQKVKFIPVLLEVLVVFPKIKEIPLMHKYERIEKFYYSKNKQTIQVGGAAVWG